jgi:hypothetical protein
MKSFNRMGGACGWLESNGWKQIKDSKTKEFIVNENYRKCSICKKPIATGERNPDIKFCEGHTEEELKQELYDFIKDNKAEGIELLEISVAEVMDYRKLLTAFPLLMKLPLQIDQTATITLGEQFIRLEYQGPYKGFNSFQNTLNTLLGSKDVKADVFLKLEFKFLSPILPEGTEISNIKSALNRNPVDRLNLMAKLTY